MCKKNVQTGCTVYIHIAEIWMVEDKLIFTDYSIESCWCYETEFDFRSIMAWGKKLLLRPWDALS